MLNLFADAALFDGDAATCGFASAGRSCCTAPSG